MWVIMISKLKTAWRGIPMNVKHFIFFNLGLILSGWFWLSSCSAIKEAIKAYPQDCIAEEILEDLVEYKFGMPSGSIDFTPFTEED